MGVHNYAELMGHVGHEIACVTYGHRANVALECVDCSEILLDFDRDAPAEPDYDDLRTLADEWRERITEMASSVPNTEGMSWGEVNDATERFLAEPEQVQYVRQYVDLCNRLGISPAEPDALEKYANDNDHAE